MPANKTQPTELSVADYIAAIDPAAKRADAKAIDAMMHQASGQAPFMYGTGIVGYGLYHYVYDSGHSGSACVIGFAARKASLVLYVSASALADAALLAKLGKHKASKGCLYINKLADVDTDVLRELLAKAWAAEKGRMDG